MPRVASSSVLLWLANLKSLETTRILPVQSFCQNTWFLDSLEFEVGRCLAFNWARSFTRLAQLSWPT